MSTTRKMNKRVKAKWLKALRSGKYAQGGGCLRSRAGKGAIYCCLGVLCHIKAQKDGKVFNHGQGDCYPGEDVQEWARLDSHNPKVRGGCLSDLNDFKKKTFPEIADLIEKYL